MLSIPIANDWLLADTWACLLSVITSYVVSPNIELHSEVNISPLVLPAKWAFYISHRNEPLPYDPKPVVISALVIFKSLPKIYLDENYERVVVLTQDMENVTSLWTRSRKLETIILVPNKTHLNAYTWFPFRRKTCFDKPPLKLMDVCENQKWKKNLFPKKLPNQFSGCPVYYKTLGIPPDNIQLPDGTFAGREPTLMKIIAEYLNLSVHYRPSTYDFYNFGKGGDNVGDMIQRGDLDFAFASSILSDLFNNFTEPLPCYRDQPIEWMFPLAKEKSQITSIYSGFPYEMWLTIFVVTLFSGLLILIASKIEGHSWYWIDMIAVTFACPINTSNSLFIRLFLLLFQFYSLHIAWFYQATLLKNLVSKPMEEQITNVQSALDANLHVYLYPWMDFYFNQTDHELWNQMLLPGNHFLTFFVKFDDIVVDKNAFLLSTTLRDAWILRYKYHKRLSDMVYLAPFINSFITVYGHRGSPLTMVYKDAMLYVIESGIFLHITNLDKGYTDLPRVKAATEAQTLKFEPLKGVFIILCSLLMFSFIVFLIEVLIVFSDNWFRRIGFLKKKRSFRRHMNITRTY